MGSRTFDGVRFSAFTEDHPPPHVHGSYGEVTVVMDLLLERRAVRLSNRRKAVQPGNAKRSHVNHVRRTAQLYFDELVALWENAR